MERLRDATRVELDVVDPDHPSARHCLHEYFAELHRRFENGFDPGLMPVHPDELRPPGGLFLVAGLRDVPVGCGALRFRPGAPTEVKRMWVAASARGLGIARRLLTDLEQRAAARGDRVLRLETSRSLTEAISLYRSAGYREVEAFNDEPYAHHWFEKHLGEPTAGT
jgi:GNAT superfamily N-acetyltransferase